MPAVAQEQEADLGYIGEVDRIEFHVVEGKEECTLIDDTRRLAQIFLHEPRRAEMCPREAGSFDVLLDFLVHSTKKECGLGPRIQAGELDHVVNSCGLGSVYERALRFDHVHGGSRDHQDSVDAVQGGSQGVSSGHVALDDFYRGDFFECCCLRSIPHQDSYRLPPLHELVHYERSGHTRRSCEKSHRNLSLGFR